MAKMNKSVEDKIAEIRKKGGIELRSLAEDANVQFTEAGENRSSTIGGYAAVTGVSSTGLWWEEIILPGAFDNTDFSRCLGLFNHNEEAVLGSVKAGTVRCTVDAKGLAYEIDTPQNELIQALYVDPIRRGDVDKSSFRFMLDFSNPDDFPDEWIFDDDNDTVIRKIKRISSVLDVSPVLFPAYDAADSSMRTATVIREMCQRAEDAKRKAASNRVSPIFYM